VIRLCSMAAEYDAIGTTYSATRVEDPRIAAQIRAALGGVRSLVNVGAGTGSYEPEAVTVVAVEPSAVMIAQRAAGRAPVVQAVAESLPFADDAFDASLGVLTVHHWEDRERGLSEMRRVARKRVVLLVGDSERWRSFWLVERYFPAFAALSRRYDLPIERIRDVLGGGHVQTVRIPHDCLDGMTGAFWRRPRAYLDERVRAGMSSFAVISEEERRSGLARLREDLASGEWERRYGHLLRLHELDIGYRLMIVEL
jgi:SAM-dependent methyltransferase